MNYTVRVVHAKKRPTRKDFEANGGGRRLFTAPPLNPPLGAHKKEGQLPRVAKPRDPNPNLLVRRQ